MHIARLTEWRRSRYTFDCTECGKRVKKNKVYARRILEEEGTMKLSTQACHPACADWTNVEKMR